MNKAITQAKKLGDELEPRKADLAASTEAAIVEVLVKKTLAALKQTGLKRVVVAGGVGANRHLRKQLNETIRSIYKNLDPWETVRVSRAAADQRHIDSLASTTKLR